jgi:hypothetical protein
MVSPKNFFKYDSYNFIESFIVVTSLCCYARDASLIFNNYVSSWNRGVGRGTESLMKSVATGMLTSTAVRTHILLLFEDILDTVTIFKGIFRDCL